MSFLRKTQTPQERIEGGVRGRAQRRPRRGARKKTLFFSLPKAPLNTLLLIGFVIPWPSFAGVLPDDRADALYHRYQGGGVTIQGPSVLVQKKITDNFAVTGNWYQDYISSA